MTKILFAQTFETPTELRDALWTIACNTLNDITVLIDGMGSHRETITTKRKIKNPSSVSEFVAQRGGAVPYMYQNPDDQDHCYILCGAVTTTVLFDIEEKYRTTSDAEGIVLTLAQH